MKHKIRREYAMKFGTQVTSDGVRFRLWAPHDSNVRVHVHDLDRAVPMQPRPRGWLEATIEAAQPGMRYTFELPDGQHVPDPAARYLPLDVDGPSEIIDPLDFEWSDRGWVGRPWEETILYEVHIGTFTGEGTFRAAIDRLDHLCALGINTIQLMPVGDFPGRWNWGYDVASLFAPDASYGRPEDMKAFVNAAHEKGLSVFLDVIYNHFGPKGNHLGTYTPLTKSGVHTPWGEALNFDGENAAMIRELIFANVRYWLEEFHLDGLRLDAAHEIRDEGIRHILMELAEQARASTDGRHVHLVLENSLNEVGWLQRRETGAPWLYDAQWSDDIHHSMHAVMTADPGRYYTDYLGRVDLVARALAEGAAWQGEYLEHEQRHKGQPSAFLPPSAFVAFMQNHDQVGNQPWGRRISHRLPDAALRMWSAIVLLSPQIPMIFMGEEWKASTPFLFFSDVGEDLADTIRDSRREKFSIYPAARLGTLPDPMSAESFGGSKLVWSELDGHEHQAMLNHYKRLIDLRTRCVSPRLHGMAGHSARYAVLADRLVQVAWTLGDGAVLELTANLRPEPVDTVCIATDDHLWLEGTAGPGGLGGWSAVFTLRTPENQG